MTRKIIGLAGRAGAGKDTAAAALVAQLGYTRLAFADPFKRMLIAGLDLTRADLENRARKEAPIAWLDGKTPRQLMQTIGTEWGRRMVHDDIWLRLMQRAIARVDGPIVITDVRFDNEARLIRTLGGCIWHIERPGDATAPAHISEAGVPRAPQDEVLTNDGSVAELQQLAVAMASMKSEALA